MTPRPHSSRRLLAVLATLSLVLAACGGGDSGDTTTITETTTTTAAETTTTQETTTTEPTTTTDATTTTRPEEAGEEVVVYLFVEAEPGFPVLTPAAARVMAAEGVEGAALQALIDGPTEAQTEQVPPLNTAIPEGTRFLGIAIEGGIATVDLSSEFESGGGSMAMFSRLAQVVYTATRFPSIEAVQIALDGEVVDVFSGEGLILSEPITRSFLDGTGLIPEVLLESPAWWQTIDSPVPVNGTTTPGTSLTWELLDDDGLPIASGDMAADDGSFSVEVPYELDRAQVGTIILTGGDAFVERAFRLTTD